VRGIGLPEITLARHLYPKNNQLSKKKKLLERKKGGRGTSMCQLHSYMSIVTGVAKEYILVRLQTILIWISQSARKMRNHASRYSIDMLGLQGTPLIVAVSLKTKRKTITLRVFAVSLFLALYEY